MEIQPMTTAAPGPTRKSNWLANVGLAIMAVAFAWWFVFYAQWTGPLRLLDLKVPCLVTTIDECSFFQSRLEEFHASGPAYQPAVWWIGMATFLAGKLFPEKLADRAGLGRDGKNDGTRE
jgi:hypothetical protein